MNIYSRYACRVFLNVKAGTATTAIFKFIKNWKPITFQRNNCTKFVNAPVQEYLKWQGVVLIRLKTPA